MEYKRMELVRFLKCANNKIVWFDFGLDSKLLAGLCQSQTPVT